MMPLHRRHVTGDSSENQHHQGGISRRQDQLDDDDDDNNKLVDRGHSTSTTKGHFDNHAVASSSSTSKSNLLKLGIVVGLQVFILFWSVSKYTQRHKIESAGHLMTVLLATFTTSFPAVVSLALGLGLPAVGSKPSDLPHQRYIPLTVVATIIGNQLPVYLSSAMAAVGIWIFGLASRPITTVASSSTFPSGDIDTASGGDFSRINNEDTMRSNTDRLQQRNKSSYSSTKQKMSGPLKTVLAVLVMIATLLTENFFVWVVSATYEPSQQLASLPTPLQDNGQITLRYVFNTVLSLSKREVVTLRNMINVEWILVSGLGLSLVAIEMQGAAMRRNLWSMALRGVLTMAAARFIRTISFLITVLPSQNPRCYFSHFPVPPPSDWGPWLLVGFTPQVNGGCNDLIISGHATVTSTLACVVTSIVGKSGFTAALWMLVAMDYMVEVYEGFHYSVDMWLGAVLVNFIWTVLAPLEDSPTSASRGAGTAEEAIAAKKFYPLNESTVSDMVLYMLPAFGSYIQVVGFIPKDLGNYTIVLYVAVVVYQISRFGFQQYTQHVLFCLLFMALGLYL